MDRFEGRIAGIGTTSGTRIVVGSWEVSPFGAFTDVMVEDAGGHRTLIAPTPEVGDYVGSTYTFDNVLITAVHCRLDAAGIAVDAGPLHLRAEVGRSTPLGLALRLVPRRLATSPRWLALIDPVAAALVPGVHTAGSAGSGRREYYGVTGARTITAADARWHGTTLGALAPLHPPVRFGFSSAPAAPQLVSVVTTVAGA